MVIIYAAAQMYSQHDVRNYVNYKKKLNFSEFDISGIIQKYLMNNKMLGNF